MQINQLKRKNPNKKSVSVGRGGKRGKTSGRGGKGQTARAGNKRRPEMREIIKKIPKLRGHSNYNFSSNNLVINRPINLGTLETYFENDSIVSPETLIEKSLISLDRGEVPQVKILADGEITKKLTIKNCLISKSAQAKVEKAGGKVE